MTSINFTQTNPIRVDTDRTGVVASVLCAIHCALTPALLLFAPAFGKIWSHPASHWIVALFVVPLAVLMMRRGFQRHRKVWVVVVGALGVSLVLIGAGIPCWERAADSTASHEEPVAASNESEDFVYVVEKEEAPVDSEDFVYVVGESEELADTGAVCVDACCPSLIAGEDGKMQLHIPLASIVTTLGGIALIVTHLGNLCCCASCRSTTESPIPVNQTSALLMDVSPRSTQA